MKQSTTELMTITCQNKVNIDGVQDNDLLFIQDDGNNIIKGIL